MKTSIEFDLHPFSQDLQYHLQQIFTCEALRVKCELNQGTLKILVQHPNVESLQGAMFSGIHRGLRQYFPAHFDTYNLQRQGFAELSKIQVYCRVVGTRRPYAAKVISAQKLLQRTHSSSMSHSPTPFPTPFDASLLRSDATPSDVTEPASSADAVASPEPATPDQAKRSEKGEELLTSSATKLPTLAAPASTAAPQAAPSEPLQAESSQDESPQVDSPQADSPQAASSQAGTSQAESSQAKTSSVASPLVESSPDESSPDISPVETTSDSDEAKSRPRSRWGRLKVAAIATVAIVSGVVLYGATRPCVIGSCGVISEAQHMGQEAVNLLQQEPTAEGVIVAYDRLIEANYRLSAIPFWSSYYDQAQLLLQDLQTDADRVAQIVSAQRIARKAAITTQNPPHPIQVWQDVQSQWQEAIAQLESASGDIMVDDLVQIKLEEYEAHLDQVNRRIAEEERAQEKVGSAREAVHLAEAREGVARSLESWQLVHVTWQVVMNRLAEVPEQTMAYAEAQQLAAIYQSRLMVAQERKVKEELSSTTYTAAVSLAEQAMSLEQEGQWTEAVSHWQKALNHVQQVPKETSYFEQAQSLLSTYENALGQAEQQMTVAIAIEQVRPILERSCRGTPNLCTFALAYDEISLYVGAGYDASVQQVMLSGGVPVVSSYGGEAAKTASLLRAIAEAGDRSQVPVAIFNSAGNRIGTYMPEFQGYVQPQIAASAEPES